jgi:hypothetical protein
MAAIQQHMSQWIEAVQRGEDEADAVLFNERMAALKSGAIDGTNALTRGPKC